MALIKSISGIRGTIGGNPGDNFTPLDIVKFAAAYGTWLKVKNNGKKIVIGRDGRMSGNLVSQLAINTLLAMGIDVIDAGLSTTPTVEMAVVWEEADGGIIITASHNPTEWNALKLLNSKGEFISAEDGQFILQKVQEEGFFFESVYKFGKLTAGKNFIEKHIDAVLVYPLVKRKAIAERNFTVVVDVINSTGALCIPQLLKALGVNNIIVINEEITGDFAHNPEPLKENLIQLSDAVKLHKANIGIAVDPDVDRLCFVCEDGEMFGEEYTLVAVADYILQQHRGATVSNLSSTKALKDITLKYGCNYSASAVGEVNVVRMMKDTKAIIGGEGNGGIIVPDLHYGRDALIGIALFLSALAEHGGTISSFRKTFPDYFMAKKKMDLKAGTDVKKLLEGIKETYKEFPTNTIDGVKIEFSDSWLHLRSSNTEPIIRIYSEAPTQADAELIADTIIDKLGELESKN